MSCRLCGRDDCDRSCGTPARPERETFERLCFGDYCVRAPKPVPWGCAPIVRMSREQLRDMYPAPGRKTHFVGNGLPEVERVYAFANPERVTWSSEWRRSARLIRRIMDTLA